MQNSALSLAVACLLALGLAAPLATAQEEEAPLTPTPGREVAMASPDAATSARPRATATPEEIAAMIGRMERLARDGRLPSYEDLRIPGEEGRELTRRYLESLPLMQDDFATTETIFGEPEDVGPHANLDLLDLIDLGLENNFGLINARRTVRIRESELVGAEAFYLPFVDLVGGADLMKARNEDAASRSDPLESTTRTEQGYRVDGGVEARQNVPTGGFFTGDFSEGRTSMRTDDGDGSFRARTYDANAGLRFTQPLLRGSGLLTGEGTNIGTADLRRARLNEISQVLEYDLRQRDVVLQIIQQYFNILQFRQQLLVSREAVTERHRFLDETRVRYDVGRVAESEILRAEIQFLQEIERALGRQQSLEDARENLLITLGLPLDTPISLMDMTPILIERERVEIPSLDEARSNALNNRYELMQADVSIALAEISRDLARNDVLPDLDFSTGYRTFDSGSTLSEANEFNRSEMDAGLSLRVPLQNVARREASRRSRIRLDQSHTDRLSLERNLLREAIQSHRGVLSTEARLTVLREQVRQARRNLQLTNDSFEVGYATVTEVRLAQDDLFDAEVAYSAAILSYQLRIAELYVAMGLPLY